MATTYNNLYLDARKRLKEAGIESAQLEAREIVCYAAGKTREQFFRDLSAAKQTSSLASNWAISTPAAFSRFRVSRYKLL